MEKIDETSETRVMSELFVTEHDHVSFFKKWAEDTKEVEATLDITFPWTM